jgi:non-specific serine/threonine protein kinase
LRGIGYGGQILISEVVAGLISDGLPEHLSMKDLGQHRLKDLLRPERIYQVAVRGVPHEFPSLVGLGSTMHNLPVQATPMVGRERLLSELWRRLLQPDVRVLTLTGPGGTGKTRVALQLAADTLDHFERGARFVDLTPIRDAAHVLPAVAQALRVQEEAGRRLADTLKDRIGDNSLLLVLDNFEQVLLAAPMIADLLGACSRLKVLATSRAVLALQGENVFPIPPLELPSSSSQSLARELADIETIQLFVQRAQAARPDFVLTDSNVGAVAAICRRLDGLPLAIELAAARVRLLAPDALLDRLDQRLSLLTGGPRDSASRHQRLRAAIAWSYELLDERQQALFRRLAVQAGGWTIEAAEALCSAHDETRLDALDGLAALADRSLIIEVIASEGTATPWFRMLETIREYALERLEACNEAQQLRDWQMRYYLDFAERAATELDGNQQVARLERLAAEHDNMRPALAWAAQSGQQETSLRLAVALSRFWLVRGHLTEGRAYLDSALAGSESVPALIRAHALHASGLLAQYQKDFGLATAQCSESLALYRALGDRLRESMTLQALGRVARLQGEHSQCQSLYDESLAIASAMGDQRMAAQAPMGLGASYWFAGDTARARGLLTHTLETFRALDDVRGMSETMSYLAFAAHHDGDPNTARSLHQEAMSLFRQLGDRRGVARAVHGLGVAASARGDYDEAAVLLSDAVGAFAPLGDGWFSYLSLMALAHVAERTGHAATGAQLLGAADALWPSLGMTREGRRATDAVREQILGYPVGAIRKQLGPQRFRAAFSQGREMTPEQAVALVRLEMEVTETASGHGVAPGR